jgi:5-methylcytosine-specific restriction protein A
MKLRVCSRVGCPNLHAGTGRCPECQRQADRTRTSGAAKYGPGHRTRFRPGVLKRDPVCACTGCTGHAGPCTRASEVADHWPFDRVDLIARGMDPDDPEHGRGLCKGCHDRWTALSRPSGFRS